MLYLDCAERPALKDFLSTGLFDGVTTNPKVLHHAGLGYHDLPALHDFVAQQGVRLFFAQARGDSLDEIRSSAREIVGLGPDVRVKIGCTAAGLTVARELAREGHQVLVTALYHPAQALAAVAAQAAWIAPYVARAERLGESIEDLIGGSARMIALAGAPTRILAASMHSLDQVAQSAASGAHDITVNSEVAEALLNEPATVEALAEFRALSRGRN